MRTISTLALTAILGLTVRARAADDRTIVFADRDDDDANGVADLADRDVRSSGELFGVTRPKKAAIAKATAPSGGDRVRLLADSKPVAWEAPIPAGAKVAIQGLRAGRADVEVFGQRLRFGVLELHAIDGAGRDVDFTKSHASLQRTPPDRLPDDPAAKSDDPDAVRFEVDGSADDLPTALSLASFSAEGDRVDTLDDVSLARASCPAGVAAELACAATLPIRAVADEIDRSHPLVTGRSIKAVLGGAIAVVSASGQKLQMLRVGGPRASEIGPIDRYRAKLRVRLVRLTAHGPPPVGGDDAGAIAVARNEVARANALWGACGISFGATKDVDIAIVDPPKAHLLALGCDHGLPASGGTIHVRVDGHDVSAKIAAGVKPAGAARVVAAAIAATGLVAKVSDNAAIGAGAFGSSDVLVRRKDGALAAIEPPASGPVSSDATLSACIGRVDLEDGLQHFGDVDAIAGTVEERALVKAFTDADAGAPGPPTIDVFLLPSFAGGGRIGESFISADGGAIRNVVLEDRAGIRADRASFALAHELGHILLDDPGHPDDFGVDTPTRLMDADAANPTAFGPRRLVVPECARAIRQSGPKAPVELLTPWPLGALVPKKSPST